MWPLHAAEIVAPQFREAGFLQRGRVPGHSQLLSPQAQPEAPGSRHHAALSLVAVTCLPPLSFLYLD